MRRGFIVTFLVILIMIINVSCNPEGYCTMVCECTYNGYSSSTDIELGSGMTRDECMETAEIEDINNCLCHGEWSPSE